MHSQTLQKINEWAKSDSTYSKFIDKNPAMLCSAYSIRFPDDFTDYDFEMKKPTLQICDERVDVDYEYKLLILNLHKGKGNVRKSKFQWKQNSPYVGINEEILRLAAAKSFMIKVSIASENEEFYVSDTVAKTALNENWLVKTTHLGYKIFAIPIYLTPRNIDLSSRANKSITSYF